MTENKNIPKEYLTEAKTELMNIIEKTSPGGDQKELNQSIISFCKNKYEGEKQVKMILLMQELLRTIIKNLNG